MRLTSKGIFGIIIIVMGLLFLLSALGVLTEIVGNFWPLVIIAIGIMNISNDKKATFTNLLLIGIGLVLQLNKIGVITIGLLNLIWPITVLVLGLWLLLNSDVKFGKDKDNDKEE